MFYYLLAINILTFCLFGWDKFCAKTHRWRVPEIVLIGMAALGGSIGAYFAMQVFRHKTQHWKFKLGIPLIIVVQSWIVFQKFICV